MRHWIALFVCLAAGLGLLAPDEPLAGEAEVAELGEAPPAPDLEAASPSYSPFVLHTEHDSLPFEHISFKDVGMSLAEHDRSLAYETLAEALSLDLQRQLADLSVQVHHTVEIVDPAAHLACEGEHIYVDLWKASEGWGYSLWSGCGEEDEFAHREVAWSAPSRDLAGNLQPLSRDIAQHLLAASRTGCFTRQC